MKFSLQKINVLYFFVRSYLCSHSFVKGSNKIIKILNSNIIMKKKNNILVYRLIVIGLVLILTSSCKKDKGQLPTLTTSEASNVSQASATCGGSITDDGGVDITDRGLCWSISQNPTTFDNKTSNGSGNGSFTNSISGLSPNTTYYVRAYATNSAGTGYGNSILIKTYTGTLTDIDGNVYYTITIGTQVWMAENLKTTSYCNGESVPNITDNTGWIALTTGAYCNYNNDVTISTTYGRLYNWYALNDNRKIAPTGWHIPTYAEWTTLTTYLGGDSIAGGQLKEIGTTHWYSPNAGASNQTGFTALPGGCRDSDGTFQYNPGNGFWWSSTEDGTYGAYYLIMYFNSSYANRSSSYDKISGYSVRCIKD